MSEVNPEVARESLARPILVVEDDEGLNRLAQKTLRRAGFSTLAAFTGAQAMAICLGRDDVIMLLDQHLPDMAGTDLVRQLNQRGKKTPFVAMTGQGDEQIAVELMKLGARDYLTKALDLTHDLPQVFHRVLRELDTEARLEKAELSLRESEERLAMALDAVSDALWDWQVETGEVFFSSRWYTMLGYEPYELPQAYDTWRRLVHPDDLAAAEATLRQHLASGKPFDMEFRMRTKQRSWKWILGRGRAVETNPSGQAVRMLGTHMDITERKRAQEERDRLQTQLLQAQKLESVGRLAGGVAHDFNNALGAIMVRADLALELAAENEEIQRHINEIQRAARRSADLTRQLLGFARQQTVSPKVIDLNHIVSNMLTMLQRLIGEELTMDWRPGANLWPVEIDPTQLDQILTNLCVNARDAIAGVGNISLVSKNISLNREAARDWGLDPGDYVQLSVQDDGCGMSPEVIEHIFEPFFTTKDVDQGTGLGLATVYGIVEQNRGKIQVTSDPGVGAQFVILLPRSDFQVEAAPSPSVCQHIPQARGETILFVEDDALVLEPVKAILISMGYQVLAARAPKEALFLSRGFEKQIHLLVTDVVMPQMNGRELATQLTRERPDLRCLFMSGYTAEVMARSGKLEPGVHFIQKPFNNRELASKIREVLDLEVS